MTNRARTNIPIGQNFAIRLDRARNQGLRMVNMALLIAGSIFTVTLFLQFGGDPVGRITSLGMLSLAIAGGASLYAQQQRRTDLASIINVYGVILALFFFYLPFGVNNIAAIVMAFPVVLAGAWFGARGIIIASVVTIVMGLTLHFVDYFKVIQTIPIIIPDQLNTGPAFTVIAGVLGFTAVLFATIRRQQGSLVGVIAETRSLESIADLSILIGEQTNLNTLLTEAVDAIRDRLGYYYVQVFLFDPQINQLTRRALTRIGRGNIPERSIGVNDPQNVIALAARTGHIEQINFDAPDARRTEFLPATRTQTLLPLKRGDLVLGVLDVHSIQNEPLSDYQLIVLEAFAAQLAIAVLAFERETGLNETTSERRRLQEQNTRLTREVDRLTQEVTDRAWTRYLASRPGGVVGYDWQNGQIAPATDVSVSLQQTYGNAMPSVVIDGADQVLGVPILARGLVIGVMEFRAPAETPWDSRSLELARTVAQRLSLTLDNIRLFEQAQINASREYMINQVASRLQSKIDLDALLRDATDAFNQAVGGTQTRIKLITPDQIGDAS